MFHGNASVTWRESQAAVEMVGDGRVNDPPAVVGKDAAYEVLLRSRRKELHRLVARTMDEKFPALSPRQFRTLQPKFVA